MNTGTLRRVATAAALIPVVVGTIWWGPSWLVAALAALIAILAALEFFAIGAQIGFRGYRFWTCLAVAAIFAQQWYEARSASIANLGDVLSEARAPRPTLEAVLLGFAVGMAVLVLRSRRPVVEVIPSVSLSAAALLFVAIPFSSVIRLHGEDLVGRQLLLFTLVLVWVGDTAAYFMGRNFGRHKLAPQWSPGKTWEGAAANLCGALLVGAAFGYWMKIEPAHMFAMSVLGNIAGQAGDLFESAFKRGADVKDSGTILPGHGGVLDRIDALVLAAPVVWYYFHWFVMRRI